MNISKEEIEMVQERKGRGLSGFHGSWFLEYQVKKQKEIANDDYQRRKTELLRSLE